MDARTKQRRAAEIWAKLTNEEQSRISMREIVESLDKPARKKPRKRQGRTATTKGRKPNEPI